MTREQTLKRAREALQKHEWSTAFRLLSEVEQQGPLEPEDLQQQAIAALLLGKSKEGIELFSRAHQTFLTHDKISDAIRCGFWVAFLSQLNNEPAQSSGWLSRISRMIENRADCLESAYVQLVNAIRLVREKDYTSALKLFQNVAATAARFRDKDILTMALLGQGRALIQQGKIPSGVALLDECMVAVTSGEVSPHLAGGVYCSVLDLCTEIFDLARAKEWTSALDRWCNAQGEPISYRGHCMVRRAEILQLHGTWPDAFSVAQSACDESAHSAKGVMGAAFYRLGELHRLRGEFQNAEEAYRHASTYNPQPQPGLALLRLMQGDVDTANASIRRIADEVRSACDRAKVLDAYVEIVLAVNDVSSARAGSDELFKIATQLDAAYVYAISERASAAVSLAEGDPRSALGLLRQSLSRWRELEAPYEAAKVQALIGLCCRELGDRDTAELELNAARIAFAKLGAAPDLARIDAYLGKPKETSLTDREIEILKLIASGMTNRQIGGKLEISEKTVARHVSNIFMKLDLNSRAAATAYAYQHGLA